MQKNITVVTIIAVLFLFPRSLHAVEPGKHAPPPPQVVVAPVASGTVSPEAEFVGTVYFREVSEVGAEVSGKVGEVLFEEGKRVKKDGVLVSLDTELLEKSLEAGRASHEEVLADLENAVIDLRRIENLYREESIAEQVYDENRFRVKGLEKKAASLKSHFEGIEVQLKKMKIRSPFEGVVIGKHVERGEWLQEGGKVATVARDDVVDIIVNVPQEVMKAAKPGMEVSVTSGGGMIKGKIFSVVPRGDIQTRTFPVKIRVENSLSLVEGMDARVRLPAGEKEKALIVPRDAVLRQSGNTVVYAVVDSAVKMITVKVTGYRGLTAGVEAEGLREGMEVVIKGNERLMDGQQVKVLERMK